MASRSLAIETATGTCSVALAEDGAPIAEASLLMPRKHAEQLVPMIESLLRHTGWMTSQLDYVAVSAGPGSYTGLRIGVSTAKGLCFATDCSLVGVSTLRALALRALPVCAPGDRVVASFDARRERVYAASYIVDDDGRLVEEIEPVATAPQDLVQAMPPVEHDVWMIGDGAPLLKAAGITSGARFLPIEPSAATVAAAAHDRWLRGEVDDVASFEPAYLREFVAKKPAESALEKLSI